MVLEKEHFHIRPSQVTRNFGPGSIYDNQRDSMLVMGLDHWDPTKFKEIRDEMLLHEIKRGAFDGVERLVSTSSFKEHTRPGRIPVRSFPAWGFCPRCDKLVPYRNNKTGRGMRCDSSECAGRKKSEGAEPPKTYPVRFVAACKNGHLDEFPWYRWVHRTEEERAACGPNDARLFLVSSSRSLSLESKSVECRGKRCIAGRHAMTRALSKNGLKFVTFGCTGRRPWLDRDSSGCDEDMKGVFKGATNIYFPLVRSAVTIPPFSDDLAEMIAKDREEVSRFKKDFDRETYEGILVTKFKLKSESYPEGRHTLEQAVDKIAKMEEFSDRIMNRNALGLEYDALDSGEDVSDAEFVTENLNGVPAAFRDVVNRIVLVKKARVVSAITGFTRLDAPGVEEDAKIASLSRGRLTWLPVIENRGEGIFFSINNSRLKKWEASSPVRDRLGKIMTVQGRLGADPQNYKHGAKYVFLHTLSHIIMKSLSKLAGYSIASFTERIYCGGDMAGILIYTYSPSSDGALGGLVELGGNNGGMIWNGLEDAILQSTLCSCDPLCSMQEIERMPRFAGASCHACALLPETCCESMNSLLDRELVDHTLRADTGFMRLRGNGL